MMSLIKNYKKIPRYFLKSIFFLFSLTTLLTFFIKSPEYVEMIRDFFTPDRINTLGAVVHVIASVLLVALVICGSLAIREYKGEIKRLRQLPESSRSATELHHGLFEYFYNKVNNMRTVFQYYTVDQIKTDKENVDRHVKESLTLSCSYLAAELSILTGTKSNVCIKRLYRNGEVHVVARDPNNRENRQTGDNFKFKYFENSAFQYIVDKKAQDFMCNDLNKMIESYGESYKNARDHWSELYNATHVVPIYGRNSSNEEFVCGFVCTDNFNGGYNESTHNVLKRYACTYENLFKQHTIYRRIASNYNNKRFDKSCGETKNNYREIDE